MNNARLTGSYRVGLQTMKGYTGIEAALSELPTAADGATYGYAFYAVDTGNTYLFNEDTNAYELASSGGGGGGTIGNATLTLKQGETTLGTFSANATEDVTLTVDTTDAITEGATALPTSGAVYTAIQNAIVEVENGTY